MPAAIHRTAHALAHALENDVKHAISSADAKKIVAAAVKDVATADDPRASLEAAQKYVDAAKLLASGSAATNKLAAFPAQGETALEARLQELEGASTSNLPQDLQDQFKRMIVEAGLFGAGRAVPVKFGDSKTTRGTRWFEFQVGAEHGEAYARLDGTNWIFAPKRFTATDVTKVKQAALDYFDETFKPDMEEWGASAAEIAAARAAWVPLRALFPGEDDPVGFSGTSPFVFVIDNQSGSDHGVYAGYDPDSGEAQVDSFN